MPFYKKKPVVIEAVQVHLYYEIPPYESLEQFCGESVKWKATGVHGEYIPCIVTLEGKMEITPGDYIIKGVMGEFYPCKPDIFEMSYDEVSK